MARKKNKAVVEGDDAKMNMTPMIDMTFLLVVFFMLTIDLTSKEFIPVQLPFAFQGIEDVEETREFKPVVVNLKANGVIVMKGVPYPLSNVDKDTLDNTLKALGNEMYALTRDPSSREPDGSSKVPVMIHADRSAQWEHIAWIMQECAQQNVQIYKIQFAVKDPDGPNSGKKGGDQ